MGLQFASAVSEDVLDRNWQRLVLTHLEEKRHKGVLCGAEITDMKITLVNGRAHIKHTEGGDFRQATYRALRQGLMRAQNVLLEPVYSFRLEIPQEQIGRAMTDIQRMNSALSRRRRKGICDSVRKRAGCMYAGAISRRLPPTAEAVESCSVRCRAMLRAITQRK